MAVRQRDVAREAGVSQAAVSLVVSGRAADGGVSTQTQERIRAVMDELGYVPNSAARSLRGGRNGLIGVHTYEPVFPADPDDYFREFLVGIEVAVAELGQDLLLFSSAQQSGPERSIYGPRGNRVKLADGTIIIGMQKDLQEIARLNAEGYPFVVLGTVEKVPETAWVAIDYVDAMAKIVADLHEMGHHHFAYVRSRAVGAPFAARCESFARESDGDEVRTVGRADLDDETITRWAQEGITAVIADSVAEAETVELLARKSGIHTPRDLSAVVLTDVPDTSTVRHWSQLRIPKQHAGRRCVAVLAEILDGNLPHDHHDVVTCLPHDRSGIQPAHP